MSKGGKQGEKYLVRALACVEEAEMFTEEKLKASTIFLQHWRQKGFHSAAETPENLTEEHTNGALKNLPELHTQNDSYNLQSFKANYLISIPCGCFAHCIDAESEKSWIHGEGIIMKLKGQTLCQKQKTKNPVLLWKSEMRDIDFQKFSQVKLK